MFCRCYSIVKHELPYLTAIPLKCKTWGCEECGENRRKQLKAVARQGHPNTFVTLTVNPWMYADAHERARRLKDAWVTVRRRACKKYGYDRIPFMAIFERTKRGEPHLHILCRVKWIDQAWLSREMAKEISAPIVDIRRVKNEKQMVRYVAKYIAKSPERFAGCKRYWKSMDWVEDGQVEDETGTEEKPKWQIEWTEINEIERRWKYNTYLCWWEGEELRALFFPG